ncbi:S8 family serine peptidase [Micromonospora sp. CB01531]|uniref:S8 family serine peptidase n=1 Tax=Micromonospora sp. CB01531 TaxID=1718947 RepID=UPI000B1CCDDE|nr:S8 family serine peptidase [Micromonospora sp. CB01531]
MRERRFYKLATLMSAVLAASAVSALPAAAAPVPSGTSGRSDWTVGVSTHPNNGHWVTLVTGDRVYLADKRVAMTPGAGRENIGFSQFTQDGHQYVVPNDALRLVSAGQVDRRLFDITGLVAAGYDDAQVSEVPTIVAYTAGAAGRARLRADGASRVTRTLPSVRGSVVRVNKQRAATFWADVTDKGSGIGKLWLDAKREVSLDQSVPQIGAPQAWSAGYDGTGVTVAVLDTGVDDTHPDLVGRIAEKQNFTTAADTSDPVGHGTHVAATIASTGAGSNGKFRGVAPGASLLIGKVCETRNCAESAILAGMEWAAPRAKVINMSLGGPDEGDDPLKAAVNTLTAQTGALFVVAAGNDGRDGGVSSPATADAALAVGAVDKQENLASFSNRGPRSDGAIKPEITAPGVGIVAALSKDSDYPEYAPGYTQLNGTSMATPHVAGAAALLAEQHPGWTAGALKAQLIASAKPNPALNAFQQGAGRVDVGRAIKQAVLPSPTSLALGTQAYPADDDVPVQRTVRYRNDGPAAVTLNLTAPATVPDGSAAPAGMFTVNPSQLTIPAGGTAETTLTANTRVNSATGLFSGAVVASSPDGTVSARVPVAITKEHESRKLTVKLIDRNGAPASDYSLSVVGIDFAVYKVPYHASGTVTTSVRVGRYAVQATVITDGPDGASSTLLTQPVYTVTSGGDAELVLDARKGTSASVTVPREGAASRSAHLGFFRTLPSGYVLDNRISGTSFAKLYAANLGGSVPADAGTLTGEVRTVWAQPNADGTFNNSPYEYDLVWFRRGDLFTNFRHTVRQDELATVVNRFHSVGPVDRTGYMHNWGFPADGGSAISAPIPFTIPGERTIYYSADGVMWRNRWEPQGPYGAQLWTGDLTYEPGRRYVVDWQKGPSAPIFNGDRVYFTRQGNYMALNVPVSGDQAGHTGYSWLDTGRMALYKDDQLLANMPTYFYDASGSVPAAESTYRLEYAVTRGANGSMDNSTSISGKWTFRSAETPGEQPTALPLASVAFRPELDVDNSARGGRVFPVPLSIERQPGAAASDLKTVNVEVSYDEGATWQRVSLQKTGKDGFLALLHQPEQGYVSLRASAAYADGATVDYTVIKAYRLR